MAFTVACYCGLTWQGEPPAACPRCGVTISDGVRIPQPAWPLTNQDEIGQHTTTSDPAADPW